MEGTSRGDHPVKDPRKNARKYQLELCETAMKENIIVYLGTGCGKTMISVLVMYELRNVIRRPNKRVCVFLAPTVPLVRQQAMVIEDLTDFKVRCFHGNSKTLMDHDGWSNEIEQCEVLVMTPQILLHNLQHCFIRMDMVALLIFDECHHAQIHRRHAYAQIMKEFYKPESERCPRIFGMTASPIVGKGGTDTLRYTKCINSLENLLDAKVCSVDDTLELESISPSPEVKFVMYDTIVHDNSSSIFGYENILEVIKPQCMQILREKLSDFEDCKKQIKCLQRWHENLLFCLKNLGLSGAVRAARTLLASNGLELDEMRTDGCDVDSYLITSYLTKAISALNYQIFDGSGDDDNEASLFQIIEEPFFSKKLLALIRILSTYRLEENTKCIIFVKRIIVANSLAYILGKIKSLNSWKCEFLVGCHSGSKNMSRKRMNAILERFRSGKVNLLVTTNVAEEGLDIQTCCLVVRFDLPDSVASFIQSRGRARTLKSEYIFLVERGNQQEGKLLADFISGENIMNREITNRSCDEAFTDFRESVYKVDKTGASIDTGCSISLLNHYCDRLPRDKYFNPSPKFFYIDDNNGTICRIVLPPNAPIRQVFSLPRPSKAEAKRHACLNACIKLHEFGALTDFLLPRLVGVKKKGSASMNDGCDSNQDEASREELHQMLVPAVLCNSWDYDNHISLQFYYINFNAIPDDRDYRMFGLFVKSPLPKEAESLKLDLHLAHGRIVQTRLVSHGIITFDNEEIVLAENFQEMFLKIILDRSEFYSDFVRLGGASNSSKFYFLLPLKQYGEKKTIDWTTVRRCLSSPVFGHKEIFHDGDSSGVNDTMELLNGPVNKTDVLDSLVFTHHNKLFFFVDGILDGTNADSLYKGTKRESYAEYYQSRFGIQLSHGGQPFLKAKQLFILHNLLHNRLQENTEARELSEHFVELPPEVCSVKIVGFSKDIGSSVSLLPSFLHRLENFLVAVELKDVLSASFPEAAKIPADLILEALTTEKCLERLSLERHEVLGDAFLKYVVGRQSFLSCEGLDEGQLTRRRASFVNNFKLYELAIAKNLQVYIRDELFDPAQFFILGRPCKQVCSEQTESSIHQQGNGSEASIVKCTKRHHWLHRKTIADIVEALVGAFLVGSGFRAATAFLNWIGIEVDFKLSDVYRVCESSKSNMSLIDTININKLEEFLGYSFNYKGLLLQAMVHPSFNKHSGGCYQKLEFLGDAVLEYLITSYLYSSYPDIKPGQITDLRSAIVNNNSFAQVAVSHALHVYLIKDSKNLTDAISKFEKYIGLSESERDLIEQPSCPKVLGDIVESCLGAVLLDSGFNLKRVWKLMLMLLKPVLSFSRLQLNPVRELRELCQSCNFKLDLPNPEKDGVGYNVRVEVELHGEKLSFRSSNRNSKAARKMAALEALSEMKARGQKHKSKSLEEILRSTKKRESELIGFDETPIVLNAADSTSFEKLSLGAPSDLCFEKGNETSSSGQNNSNSSTPEGNSKDQTGRCIVQPVTQSHDGATTTISNCSQDITGSYRKTAKSRLMEISVANSWKPPVYECCQDEGPPHKKMFIYKVTIEVPGATPKLLECFSEPRPQKKAATEHSAEGALWYLQQIGYNTFS